MFEDGEESDVLFFDSSDPNFEPATIPTLKLSKPIVYEGQQSVQAGEYEGKLTIIVVAREDAETFQQLESQTSAVQITIIGMLYCIATCYGTRLLHGYIMKMC